MVLALLVLTIKYAYRLMRMPDQTPAVCIDNQTQHKEHVSNNAPIVTQTASSTEAMHSLITIAQELITELHKARSHTEQDLIMRQTEKDALIADIKATISQLEHSVQESLLDPADTQKLLGPVGSSTRVVFERALGKKLLACAQEAELLVLRLYNELQGTHKPLVASKTASECLAHIKELLTQLQ
jgi:hypothetical protein